MVLKVPKYLSILQSFGVFLDNNKDDYTLITSKFGVINTFYLLLLYAFTFNANSWGKFTRTRTGDDNEVKGAAFYVWLLCYDDPI